jgi:hypothetical protein
MQVVMAEVQAAQFLVRLPPAGDAPAAHCAHLTKLL